MQRRTVLQILAAFFASFFGRFRRLGELGPIARLRGRPTSPLGKVSPKAAWFSPPTYELASCHSAEHLAEIQQNIREGATFPPTTRLLRPGVNTPPAFVFRVDPGYTLEPQEGYEVMVLKNPPTRTHVMGAMNGPPPEYVVPTGPVQSHGGAWTPLETFRPLKTHPDLSATGTLIGTMQHPARAPRQDISNDTEFKAITGGRLSFRQGTLPDLGLELNSPSPSAEEIQRQADVQARIDANYRELLDNWDAQRVDRMDVQSAKEATDLVRKEYDRLRVPHALSLPLKS